MKRESDQRVVISGFDMTILDWAFLIVKSTFAAIPALIMIVAITFGVFLALGASLEVLKALFT